MATVKHPCRNCIYFKACGDNMRTALCKGRVTKSEKKRKTRDKWDIEVNRGYGWEVECSEYTYREAKEQEECYRQNIDAYGKGISRLTKRREPV